MRVSKKVPLTILLWFGEDKKESTFANITDRPKLGSSIRNGKILFEDDALPTEVSNNDVKMSLHALQYFAFSH